MNFLVTSNQIIEKLCFFLDQNDLNYSLLIGGGIGYESLKYINSTITGDIDLFVLVDEGHIELFLNKVTYFVKKESGETEYDLKLFKEEKLSVVRRKISIEEVEISFNVSSFERMSQLYNLIASHEINKLAYSKTNHLFIARSLRGCKNLAVMISERIKLQGENVFLVPDRTFILAENDIYIGLFTDFILKGRVIRDYLNRLFIIKNQIIKHIKPILGPNGEDFLKVLANNEKFSESIRNSLKKDYENVKVRSFANKQVFICPNKTLYLNITENVSELRIRIENYIKDQKIDINKDEDLYKLNSFLISLY